MKKISEYTLGEIVPKIKKIVFYVSVFAIIAFSGVVYATWNDAKTGGTGQLTEFNWNALIAQLQSKGGVTGGCTAWLSGGVWSPLPSWGNGCQPAGANLGSPIVANVCAAAQTAGYVCGATSFLKEPTNVSVYAVVCQCIAQ